MIPDGSRPADERIRISCFSLRFHLDRKEEPSELARRSNKPKPPVLN